jgi:hypothetical protein
MRPVPVRTSAIRLNIKWQSEGPESDPILKPVGKHLTGQGVCISPPRKCSTHVLLRRQTRRLFRLNIPIPAPSMPLGIRRFVGRSAWTH